MTKDEALRLALEALENLGNHDHVCPQWPTYAEPENYPKCNCGYDQAITAIKAALEAKCEPVVWNEGVPAMLPKQKEGETFIVSYEPKLEAKDEPVVNTDHVICPNCVHQFRAIPQNVQKLMLASGFEPPFTTPPQRTEQEQQIETLKRCLFQMQEAAKDLVEQAKSLTPPNQEAKDEPVGTAGELFSNTALERLDLRPSTNIYITPPQRKPLTDEEIERIWESLPFCNGAWETFARAIEAAHGIKGEA